MYNYVYLQKQTANYSYESCITRTEHIFVELLHSRSGAVWRKQYWTNLH